MPPKLIIVHAKIKTYYDMPFDEVIYKMIVKNTCMIRTSKKKRMGQIASIVNATTMLPTIIHMIPHFDMCCYHCITME